MGGGLFLVGGVPLYEPNGGYGRSGTPRFCKRDSTQTFDATKFTTPHNLVILD